MVTLLEIGLGAGGILLAGLGIWVTFHFSKKYYEKSTNYSLTPYLIGYEPFFQGLDDDIEENLEILYKGDPVENLTRFQILVGNDGDQPLSDFIEGPNLELPDHVDVLDSDIIAVDPEGRNIELAAGGESISLSLDVSLLNPFDYAIIEVLTKGSLNPKNLDFSVTAEHLDPELELETNPPEPTEKTWTDRFKGAGKALSLAVVFGAISFSSGYVVYVLAKMDPSAVPFLAGPFTLNTKLFAGILLSGVLALLFGLSALLSVVGILASLFDTSSPGFDIPSDVGRRRVVVHHPIDSYPPDDVFMNPTVSRLGGQ